MNRVLPALVSSGYQQWVKPSAYLMSLACLHNYSWVIEFINRLSDKGGLGNVLGKRLCSPLSPALSPALQAVKYPKNAYRYLQLLVGQKFDSPMVHKYRQWFPFYDLKKDEDRGKRLQFHEGLLCYLWL